MLLPEPLSFWGGYDSIAGRIIEAKHPCFGRSLSGSILVMPRAKGSSSSSSVLAEAIRYGTGPAGIILRERDLIIAIGVITASELYDMHVPLVVVDGAQYDEIAFAEAMLRIDAPADSGDARITLSAG